LTAVWQNNHAHAELCRWGLASPHASLAADAQISPLNQRREFMETDGVEVLKHGMTLGKETWQVFKDVYPWRGGKPQKIITHQVGGAHRQQMLNAFGLSAEDDFPTYAKLGNMGTASIPISFAMAAQAQHFVPGDEIGILGIGSGLTTLMLGVEWQPLSQ
jgi:3-oxoacyl-[acyl-carrier-protein] synthase-3